MSNQARKEPHAAFALVAALRAIPTGLGIAYGRGRELLKRARFSIGLRVDRDKIDFDSGTGRGVRQESRVLPNSCWSDRLQPPPDGAFVIHVDLAEGSFQVGFLTSNDISVEHKLGRRDEQDDPQVVP